MDRAAAERGVSAVGQSSRSGGHVNRQVGKTDNVCLIFLHCHIISFEFAFSLCKSVWVKFQWTCLCEKWDLSLTFSANLKALHVWWWFTICSHLPAPLGTVSHFPSLVDCLFVFFLQFYLCFHFFISNIQLRDAGCCIISSSLLLYT